MSEQDAGQVAPVVSNEAQTPAPATAPAESQVTDTQAETHEETSAVEKTYSKAELQELVEKATAKAAAKAERRAYREALQTLRPQSEVPQPQAEPTTRRENESESQYIERLVEQGIARRDHAGSQKALASKTEGMYAEAAKLPGFDRDEFNALPLTPMISQALVESDAPAKLMQYMTLNPEDVERIATLSPARQAAEMGKLELKVASAPKTSKAPAPISPIGSRGSAISSTDLANLPMEQYIEARRKQGARWAR